MNPVLQRDAEKFAAFILEHCPETQTWKDPVGFCAWYISHGFIVAVTDGDQIVAIAAGRPVDRPGMGVLSAYYNEFGSCLHIDLLVDITDDNRAINALCDFCKGRFPHCKVISLFKHFEEHIRVYSMAKFFRSLKKIRRRKKEQTHELVEH
jgi:hypothetical protein